MLLGFLQIDYPQRLIMPHIHIVFSKSESCLLNIQIGKLYIILKGHLRILILVTFTMNMLSKELLLKN